ncbi:hypothetical protein C483_18278 [Natrialba hulunbeirensis JCM 10989]|uniref:Uncharacterized protein n=1 Tax=Natrialba hulunbeirensis JCM 10989 TaxID=1227493 RepID=L9ZP79_9EURY|nr:DUF6498-containing protein [Natrialba hulunbeirensis]ELY87871.1 hypothetical protein C483_18278 [Natrialba hulunbeirensis JCM 10989]
MGVGQRSIVQSPASRFVPILLANLLPVVGIVWFDWHASEVVVIYWLEVIVMLLVYGVAALFARQRIILEHRRLFLPGVSEETELCESK